MSAPKERENIVIIGGGVIGCTTAYYLTRHPRFNPSLHTVTIVEAAKLANGASGKAGGLLASWAYPSNLAGLSFDLHERLAKEHNGTKLWGYRRVNCGQLTAIGQQSPRNGKAESGSSSTILLGKIWGRDLKNAAVLPDDLTWLDPEAAQAYEEFADMTSTAQVNPLQFTTCLANLAEEGGATIVMGTVDHINCRDVHNTSGNSAPLTSYQDLKEKKVVSVTYTDKITSEKRTILASSVVLAAGPWTPTIMPTIRMAPLRAHSVTIKLKRPVSAYCLFSDISFRESSRTSTHPEPSKSSASKVLSLEMYGRPNNEVYICSQGDFDTVLPAPTDAAEVSAQRCQEIIDAVTSVSDELRHGQVTSRRACYLPITDVGVNNDPMVGYTELEGLLLATRHSCWGISNAPATGKVISELIFDGEVRCINAGNLDPRRIL